MSIDKIYLQEQAEIQRRLQAVETLINSSQVRSLESLDARINRAFTAGQWTTWTRADCAARHAEEKAYLEGQLKDLRRERARLQEALNASEEARRHASQQKCGRKGARAILQDAKRWPRTRMKP
jgi:hypothetical protein